MKNRSIFWGSFFVIAALVIVLNALDLFALGLVSLVFSIILISISIKSLQHLNFFGVFMPLAIIAILFDSELGIESLTPLPVLVVAVFLSTGFTFIFPRKPKWVEKLTTHNSEYIDTISSEIPEDGVVNISSRFGGVIRYINSNQLKMVNISSHFSGTEVYFDGCVIDGNEAYVNLDVSFSGVTLYVPRNWNVSNQANCALGGIDEKASRLKTDGDKTLILKGKVSLGGVEVHYI